MTSKSLLLSNFNWDSLEANLSKEPHIPYLLMLIIGMWDLRDRNVDFELKWDFIDRAPPFNPITRKCRLSLKEKYHIMYNLDASTLNKRNEVFNTCRHRTQKLLINVKAWAIIIMFHFSLRYRKTIYLSPNMHKTLYSWIW